MTKKIDPDILVLKNACRALDKSSSRRMLRANIQFIIDRYLTHPTKSLPAHLLDGYVPTERKEVR